MKKRLKDLTFLSKFLFDQTMIFCIMWSVQTESLPKKPAAPVLKGSMNVSAG